MAQKTAVLPLMVPEELRIPGRGPGTPHLTFLRSQQAVAYLVIQEVTPTWIRMKEREKQQQEQASEPQLASLALF